MWESKFYLKTDAESFDRTGYTQDFSALQKHNCFFPFKARVSIMRGHGKVRAVNKKGSCSHV